MNKKVGKRYKVLILVLVSIFKLINLILVLPLIT